MDIWQLLNADCEITNGQCQFIGVTDIEFIHANGLDLGEEFRQRGLNEARTKIQDLVINW